MAYTFVPANNDYIDYGDNNDMGISDWSCWAYAKTSNSGTAMSIVGKESFLSTADGFYFYKPTNDTLRYIFGNGSTSRFATSTATINTGAALTLGGSLDRSGNIITYVSGAQDGSTDATALNGADIQNAITLQVGALGSNLAKWDGTIYSVAMWSRVVTPAEFLLLEKVRNPFFVPDSLVFAANYMRNVNDVWGGLVGTNNGADEADNERMYAPGTLLTNTSFKSSGAAPTEDKLSRTLPGSVYSGVRAAASSPIRRRRKSVT